MAAPVTSSRSSRPDGNIGLWRSHLGHAVAVVATFTVLFTWVYARPILSGSYLAESDIYEYFLPDFLAPATIWSGFEFGGTPTFADPGDSKPYPLHAFFRLFGAWNGFIVAAFVIAASGTYAYVYAATRSKTAAAFAGLAFGLSEAMMERIAHVTTIQTLAWLPLILLSIDRLRGPHARRWLVIGALSVGTALLAGNPQALLYVLYAAGAYAITGGLAERAGYRYWLSGVAMVVLGGLLGTVKVAPLLETSLYTARQGESFGQFVSHANTPAQMLSMLFPTIAHEGREAPTYVGMATLIVVVVSLWQWRRQWRVAFWGTVAAICLLIGAGDATPVAQIIYRVPFYDTFRVSARHLYIATFALVVLAGIGIEALQRKRLSRAALPVACAIVILACVGAAEWLAARPALVTFDELAGLAQSLPRWNIGIWIQFAIVANAVAAWTLFASGWARQVSTVALLALLAGDLLHALPYDVTPTGIEAATIPGPAAGPSVHATRLAAGTAPLHQRTLSVGGSQLDDIVPGLWARVWQIPIAGGYGPMLLSSHAALGLMGTNGSVEQATLRPDDAALDLMAVKYITLRPEDRGSRDTLGNRDLEWTAERLALSIGRPECGQRFPRTVSYWLPADAAISGIALETHLGCAEDVPQEQRVATLRVIGADGAAQEFPLRAGVETAEQGLSEPNLQRRARHQPAVRFDDSGGPFTYFTRLDLPAPVRGARVEIVLDGTAGWLEIDRLTLVDDAGRSLPQRSLDLMLADPGRWREVAQIRTSRVTDRGQDDEAPGETVTTVFENLRARPRVWVAREVVALNERDMLAAVHYSVLPDGRRFEPATMALVAADAEPVQIPTISPDISSSAEIMRLADGSMTIAVRAPAGGFLVVSESSYPGWRARIDDRTMTPLSTNISLQGVPVPPGTSIVTFEFGSTTQRAGVTAALIALAVLGGIALSTRPWLATARV